MRLFRVQGRISPIVEITKSVTDPAGRFEFPSLAPPRPDDPLDPLFYMVFADADDRPIGAGGIWNGQGHEGNAIEIRILREKTTLSGIVLGADGHPVAGAAVAQWAINGRPVPGILSATTGPDGRFLITRIPYYDWVHAGASAGRGLTFTVFHPDHPVTDIEARELPRNVSVRMPRGCLVTGTVTDSITGRPASGALVRAARVSGRSVDVPAVTDDSGRFKMVLDEDRYHFFVRTRDRVCNALSDRECLAGTTLELPNFKLIGGGFIAGQVKNGSTGEPIARTDAGSPIVIGLIGPSEPNGMRLGTVDHAGRFKLRRPG